MGGNIPIHPFKETYEASMSFSIVFSIIGVIPTG